MYGSLRSTWFGNPTLQVESLQEAMESAKAEKQAAEEERGHAHEQVLSLIRECNALEEQVCVSLLHCCPEKSHVFIIPCQALYSILIMWWCVWSKQNLVSKTKQPK